MAGFQSSWEFAADLPPEVQSVELTDVNDVMPGHGRFTDWRCRQQALRYRRWLQLPLTATWTLCPALVLRPAVYLDGPASISSTSANWSLLLLTLDFCLSTSESAVSRHDVSSTSFAEFALCQLLLVSLKHSKLQCHLWKCQNGNLFITLLPV